MNINLSKSIYLLCEELKKDDAYYYSWQANIAMAFKDRFHNDYLVKGIHEISNESAKDFLNLLIRTTITQENNLDGVADD